MHLSVGRPSCIFIAIVVIVVVAAIVIYPISVDRFHTVHSVLLAIFIKYSKQIASITITTTTK